MRREAARLRENLASSPSFRARRDALGDGAALQQLILGSQELGVGALERSDVAALDDLADVAVDLQAHRAVYSGVSISVRTAAEDDKGGRRCR